MKVSSKVGNPVQSAETAKLTKTNADAGSAKTKSAVADSFGSSARVDVSQRGQDIKKAKELATPRDNDIDEAKVARLQALIDAGKYKVDASKIADKLVDEHMLTSD